MLKALIIFKIAQKEQKKFFTSLFINNIYFKHRPKVEKIT